MTGPREQLGNKGFHLDLLRGRGYPVPSFRVVTADEVRAGVNPTGVQRLLDELRAEAAERMGLPPSAVAFAVRSSPPVSMPGMMDTLLAVGLTDDSVPALATHLGSAELARNMVEIGRVDLRTHLGVVPESPVAQVCSAITAVRDSWHNERAREYRRAHDISERLSPAVVVQAMAFGTGDRSGSGVVFSHDPRTGRRGLHGEYVAASTGAALVAGQVTPDGLARLKHDCPQAYTLLDRFVAELFAWRQVMIEVEFVVERGRLWLVQMRAATASPAAHNAVTVDAWRTGIVDRNTALTRLSLDALCAAPEPRAAEGHARLLATGIAAAGGVATGRIVRAAEEVLAHAGEPVVLLRPTTEPEDFVGMANSAGIVTLEGGFGSHAAVVARELGRPAVVGARFTDPHWLENPTTATITVCGTTGRVWEGTVPTVTPPPEWPTDLLGTIPADTDRRTYLETLTTSIRP
ncbi:PEP/pyruvate-binding domain-containing protein [Nocardia terpenica]|uniref:Pyruvate, phosphate dikinase n=1 Tax=Nocardia terpenica TaxID=455432 RepID=A0A164I2B1_9NOCA|nr:PEP/pyruvate-binding domain-containing protein [Nocardia terpenica]KZM69037.1 hypothetical protein AWN90_14950 [Nocardia terpenica]NQE87868.1 hypothetical protein [Nocardia terpenica]